MPIGIGHAVQHAIQAPVLVRKADRLDDGARKEAGGLARLLWDSVPGADAYLILRDGREVTGPLRIEGARKEWTDTGAR